MAYATVEDLAKRWRPLSPSEMDRAEMLLDDAGVLLEAEFRRADKLIDECDEFVMSALRIVSCAIVKRMMASTVDGDYSQISRTAGSFNEQFTFANPSGDMYITAREYKMLGIPQRSTGATYIGPRIRGDDCGWRDCDHHYAC